MTDTLLPRPIGPGGEDEAAGPSHDWTDQRLVEACLAGDQRGWAVLITRYQRLIQSFPRRYGADQFDSADVFQLVCAELFLALPRLRSHGSVKCWIATVAAHQAYKWKRAHIRRQLREGDDLDAVADIGISPSRAIEHAERDDLIRKAIARLKDRERELVRLLFYQDPPMSYDDLAKHLGLAKGSLGMMRSRCLRKLQRMLALEYRLPGSVPHSKLARAGTRSRRNSPAA